MKEHIRRAIQNSALLNPLYELIGYDAVVALLKQFGGRQIYVPMKYGSENHPIVKAIGIEAAEKLSWMYACEQIGLPTARIITDAERDHEILKMRKEGKTVAAMAQRFKLSERRIRVILSDNKKACRDYPVPTVRKNSRPRHNRQADLSKGQLELFPKI